MMRPSGVSNIKRRLVQSLIILFFSAITRVDADTDTHSKTGRVCTVLEGLELTRLVSSRTRAFFKGAIEDVELIREVVSESMTNGGIRGGLSDLDVMAQTLDWQARNLPSNMTTIDAGLAWVDDRPERRIERYVSQSTNQPLVGTKASDMAAIDAVSNLFPWIVDRRSIERKWWLQDHQNGRSEGANKEDMAFQQLYVAAWIGTHGEAWMYYPPIRVYGHPFTFAEILGSHYNSHEEEFVRPNLPENNPNRTAYFTAPYPDTAVPGLSLITAQAPIYYTGIWQNQTYDQTYLASTGVDIAVSAVSTLLEELEATLTPHSFAMLVDTQFNMVVISQSTVQKIYPPRTGLEDFRVTYDLSDPTGNKIATDRRNQTYQVSDTILQSPRNLTNADWERLHHEILQPLERGERGYTTLDIVLTNTRHNVTHLVMYERWPSVADWILLSLAPKEEIETAIRVHFEQDEQGGGGRNTTIQTLYQQNVQSQIVFVNEGYLDVTVRLKDVPEWIEILKTQIVGTQDNVTTTTQTVDHRGLIMVQAGQQLVFEIEVLATKLGKGITSRLFTLAVHDDHYPDCFYQQEISTTLTVNVVVEPQLNQISHALRVYGLCLTATIVATSIGFAFWVHLYQTQHVVRAAQPLFLYLLCVGTLVMGLSIIPLGIDDSVANQEGCNRACMAFPWLLAMGFSLAFSALFSKIWRVLRIFQAAVEFRRIRIQPRDVALPLLVICSLNVILLTAWTLTSPLHWSRLETNPVISHGTCWAKSGTTSKAFMASLLVINFLAVLLANVLACRARNIDDVFSESKYIAVAMASMCQIYLLGCPLLFLVNDSPKAFFFVMSSIVFVTSMSLLLLIFVPKLLYRGNETMSSSSGAFTVASTSVGGRTSFGLPVNCRVDPEVQQLRLELEKCKKKLEAFEYVMRDAGMTLPEPTHNTSSSSRPDDYPSDVQSGHLAGLEPTSELSLGMP